MPGYENAPATIMLATQCAVCGRPLVDAKSVETGMGPDCRKKHGYNVDVTEEARTEANKLVHYVACARNGDWLREQNDSLTFADVVASSARRLETLGFEKLAQVLVDRAIQVRIRKTDGGRLVVRAPYRDGIGVAMRDIPGRRWDKETKVNTIPDRPDAKRALFAVLVSFFPGQVAYGPRGPFVLLHRDEAA